MNGHNSGTAIFTWAIVSGLCIAVALGGCRSSRPQRKKQKQQTTRNKAPVENTRDYIRAVIHSKTMAETVRCQHRLAALGRELHLYAATNGKFPDSLAELNQPELLKSPIQGSGQYTYISGLDPNGKTTEIIVYQSEVNHKGNCHVLYIGGSVSELSPQQLKDALAQTKNYIE